MPVFTTRNGKLKKLSSLAFAKEKELQTLVEKNLDELLGMYFLATEYTTTFGGRIDTLAVDHTGAPVIIVDCRDPVPRKCQVIVPVHDRGRPGSISYQA